MNDYRMLDVTDIDMTKNQRKVAIHYLTHNDPAAAYKAVYKADCSNEEARKKALVVLKNPQVIKYIKMKEQEAAELATVSVVTHIESLKRLRDLAELDGKYAAAIKAEEQIGKVSGLYIERKEVKVEGGTTLAVAIVPAKQIIDRSLEAVEITIDNKTLTGA